MSPICLSAVDGSVRDIEINPPSRCDRHNSFSVPRSEESLSKKRIHYMDGADDAVRVCLKRYRSMDQIWYKSTNPTMVRTDRLRTE